MLAEEKISVEVKTTKDIKRWNYFKLIENGEEKDIFLVFDTEFDDVFIDYTSVAIIIDGEPIEYELTHKEEEAVITYISDNYGGI